jgi:hypothetical protein
MEQTKQITTTFYLFICGLFKDTVCYPCHVESSAPKLLSWEECTSVKAKFEVQHQYFSQLYLLEWYCNESDNFFNCIITGSDSWIHYHKPQSKHESFNHALTRSLTFPSERTLRKQFLPLSTHDVCSHIFHIFGHMYIVDIFYSFF